MTVLTMCVFALPARADGPEGPFPGGDVLRPDRGNVRFYLGADAGISASSFMGKLVPHIIYDGFNGYYLWAPFTNGSGVGPLLDGVLDIPLSKDFGFVFKLGWTSRTEKFSTAHIDPIFYVDAGTMLPAPALLRSTMDLDVSYVTADFLLRYQLAPQSWYLLAGLAYSNLLSNEGTFTQDILQPTDLYFDGLLGSGRSYTQTGEFSDITKSRWALKAGVGTWIPLSKSVFFTPELCIDYPLTKFVEGGGDPLLFVDPSDSKFMTVSLTLGLRIPIY
jgi:hypothetical protein